jgi:hypothetical protein
VRRRERSQTALVAGGLYVLLGLLFLLDRLDVLAISGVYMLPVLLIGLGVAVLLSAARRRPAPEPDVPTADEPAPEPDVPTADEPAPADPDEDTA